MSSYQVMTYRVGMGPPVMGAGHAVQLPDGWAPLAAMRQGEVAVILCYQELAGPPPGGGGAPVVDSISPNTLAAGGTPASVDVLGSGFDTTSVIYADSAPRSTFFIDAHHLQYTSRPDLANSGTTVQITVQGSNGTSNAVPFTFT